jgi:hypothetical protein
MDRGRTPEKRGSPGTPSSPLWFSESRALRDSAMERARRALAQLRRGPGSARRAHRSLSRSLAGAVADGGHGHQHQHQHQNQLQNQQRHQRGATTHRSVSPLARAAVTRAGMVGDARAGCVMVFFFLFFLFFFCPFFFVCWFFFDRGYISCFSQVRS